MTNVTVADPPHAFGAAPLLLVNKELQPPLNVAVVSQVENFELIIADKETRNKFGDIVLELFNQIDVLNLKSEILKQTRDLLLPRLISGEIDVENLEVT